MNEKTVFNFEKKKNNAQNLTTYIPNLSQVVIRQWWLFQNDLCTLTTHTYYIVKQRQWTKITKKFSFFLYHRRCHIIHHIVFLIKANCDDKEVHLESVHKGYFKIAMSKKNKNVWNFLFVSRKKKKNLSKSKNKPVEASNENIVCQAIFWDLTLRLYNIK